MFKGKIIYIDDDEDDGMIFSEVYEGLAKTLGLHTELLIFSSGSSMLHYVEENAPEISLIISDINMPEMNGFQLKEAVNRTKYSALPYVLYSTASPATVGKDLMSKLHINGFYVKQTSYKEMENQLTEILQRWRISS